MALLTNLYLFAKIRESCLKGEVSLIVSGKLWSLADSKTNSEVKR